jgi:vacuolar-type H+-ATPase subunit I/STV1
MSDETTPAADEPVVPQEPPKNEEKLVPQTKVNSLVAAEKRKYEETAKKALAELEQIKQTANMTAQEKQSLEERMESLRNEFLTKEELAKKEKATLEKKYQTDLEGEKSASQAWRERYTAATIERSIADAANQHNAFSTLQIEAILKPLTKLEEILDDNGKSTGSFKPVVAFNDVTDKGEPILYKLSPSEAVKKMSEKDEFFNLFKSEATGGVGGYNVSSVRPTDMRAIASNPEKYREMRAKGQLPK